MAIDTLDELSMTERIHFLNLLAIIICVDRRIDDAEKDSFLLFAKGFDIGKDIAYEMLEEKFNLTDDKIHDALSSITGFFNSASERPLVLFIFYAVCELCFVDGEYAKSEEKVILQLREDFGISMDKYNSIINEVKSVTVAEGESSTAFKSDEKEVANLNELIYIARVLSSKHSDLIGSITDFLDRETLVSKEYESEMRRFFGLFFEQMKIHEFHEHLKEAQSRYKTFNVIRINRMFYKTVDVLIKEASIFLQIDNSSHGFVFDALANLDYSKKAVIMRRTIATVISKRLLTRYVLF